jgi:hypothetical protein
MRLPIFIVWHVALLCRLARAAIAALCCLLQVMNKLAPMGGLPTTSFDSANSGGKVR